MIGSAVPASLRNKGLLACWILFQDGEVISDPLTSLVEAQTLLKTLARRQMRMGFAVA